MLLQLTHPKKPVVGVLTALPMNGSYNEQTGHSTREPWAVMSQLSQLFTVHTISESATGIDKDVDVLMLVHPKNLSQPLLFAIDQYVAVRGGRGGHFFVDPTRAKPTR